MASDQSSAPKLIIVVGCQRSGTTLVGQMLGSHPNAVMIDENDGLYDWFSADSACLSQDRLSDILIRAKDKYIDPSTRFGVDQARTVLHENIRYLVLKAPNLTFSFDDIANHRNGAHIVYMVRDPRAVVASMGLIRNIDMVANQAKRLRSMASLAERFSDDLSVMENTDAPGHRRRAHVWKVKSGLVEDFRLAGLTVSQVKYETVVDDPGGAATLLCDAAGMSHEESVGRHHLVMKGKGPGKTVRERAVDRSSIDRYADSLTAQEQSDVMHIAGPVAEYFGYSSH